MTLHPVVTAWLLLAGPLWASLGAWDIPRRYRNHDLDASRTRLLGGLAGWVGGPLLLVPLRTIRPELTARWAGAAGLLAVVQLYALFATVYPHNLCVTNGGYVLNQLNNGLTIGTIYALMAVGLTLIYSVQGVISFAHGQFYMIGGYVAYYVLQTFGGLNPVLAVPAAGLFTALLGMVFERAFLRPMHLGKIERAAEYAILVTFGFGFFLEYTTLAIVGPFPRKTDPFVLARSLKLGPLHLLPNRLVAAAVGLGLIFALLYLIRYTWLGKGLRAVSQDKQAAAVAGVNPLKMNTLAFGIGTMLADMSGAALIPVFSWVPWVGTTAALRSFVIIVLGGLGSIPGALFGGLIIGVVQALGAGCYPDASSGASYKEAFGLVIFALILLLRPTGLFGRAE